MKWENSSLLESRKYVCGFCDNTVASNQGYYQSNSDEEKEIFICPYCENPSYFRYPDYQVPGIRYGRVVSDIPDQSVESLYNEARNCISSNSFTGSVLCSRKLLMNIAVSKGAKEGEKFVTYVQFLSDNGYIPPDGKQWVDHIRKKGNEATHEITIMTREDAEELIDFIEMLLKFMFEFPAMIKRKT